MARTDASPAGRRGIFRSRVVGNTRLCDEHFLVQLDAGADFPPSRPGQFVQLLCCDGAADTGAVVHEWAEGAPPHLAQPELVGERTLLRRPFSLAGRKTVAGRAIVEIIHRVVGVGTGWLARAQPGDAVDVLGPLGNGFSWPESLELAVLVGGGVGIPPMLYLAAELAAAGKRAVAFAGATSRNLLPLSIDETVGVSSAGWPTMCVRELARFGVEAAITTDDGSLGLGGYVTEALWRWFEQGRLDSGRVAVYTCGPEPMMRAVAQGCTQRGLACQVAMERQMACGMGTCQSCVCRVHADNEAGWQFKLVCTDGPVFEAGSLVWDSPGGRHARREEHGKDRPSPGVR